MLHAPAQDPIRDPERLAGLHATNLLDAPIDAAFDRLTRLATRLLEAPLSTVTLVDSDRQFYLSCAGFPEPIASERQTPLEFSFCKHTVVLGRPLIIPDTRDHPIVGDNPAIGEFGVTAYAGIPLLTADGHALGTLCVMDFKVREWTDDQISSLTDLAAAVSTEIELRMDIAERMRVEMELQRTVRWRDQVLGIVSHDLRNPVHTIGLSAGVLLDTTPDDGSAEMVRAQAGIIQRISRQMDRMIRDLLDASSIAAGRLSMNLAPRDAVEMVRMACDALRPLVEEKGLRLWVEIQDKCVMTLADGDRITQVLSNLTGNAIKFTSSGGKITVALHADEQEARVSVADTGAGIPAEHLPRLFDQFWRGRGDSLEGAGLGLAITRGIVDAHGGRIWVESVVGEGTTVHFTLPVTLLRGDQDEASLGGCGSGPRLASAPISNAPDN
ncbi:MAG: GAF domain-containing sensor histidine kinase [Gemmatimonadota bacterium]|nr:GAF domain-containing sensor histidine kinase [Gemmatimonadota bacterium]